MNNSFLFYTANESTWRSSGQLSMGSPAPDLDGRGLGPGVVGRLIWGYKMFRYGMIDEVTSFSTHH